MARSTGSTIWKVLVGVLVAILLILIVAEFGLRWFIGQQLRTSFNEQAQETGVTVQEDPSISFGATPLIFSFFSGNVNEVDISTPSTLDITYPGGDSSVPEITGQPAAVIEIDDLDISDTENPVAGHLVTSAEVSDDFLLAIVQRQMAEQQGEASGPFAELVQGLVRITDITSNPAESTLDVEFSGGAAVLSLRPLAVDGQLSFEATDASLLGINLPQQVVDGITTALQNGVSEQIGQLNIEEVTVIDGGVRIRVSGDNINLNDLSGQGGQVPAS